MSTSSSTELPKGSSSPPGGQLQKAATTSLTAAWLVYRSFLARPVAQVVPEPTREAVFQLFCDIRANVPKDKRFLQRHARAFTPQTSMGWLALSGVLGYAVSAALLVTTLTLGISVAGLSMGLMAVLATGAFLASALGFMAFVLFTSAFVVGAVAFTALSGYVVGSSSLAVMRHITQLVFGQNEMGGKRSVLTSLEGINNNTSSTTTTSGAAASPSLTGINPVITSEADRPTTPTTSRFSTYAAPHVVLPPIKTASPTRKRSLTPTTSSSLSGPLPPAASVTTSPISSGQNKEASSNTKEEEKETARLSPSSCTSTSTAAKYTNSTTPKAATVMVTAMAVDEDISIISLEKEKSSIVLDKIQNEQGETRTTMTTVPSGPTPMNNKKPTVIAVKTNKTTPSGTRTITMIKSNNNNMIDNTTKKISSPAPLPGPPPSTAGLLKPISPATSSITATSAARDTTLSFSLSSVSTPIVNSISNNDTSTSDNDSLAFIGVMQGWKEIEKKAAMESPNGGGAKVPLPPSNSRISLNSRNKSKKKGRSSRKSSQERLSEVEGVTGMTAMVPKTPETS
jgi:hypothetical protein